MSGLSGQVAVVTGAGSGIGEAVAQELHSLGATVVKGVRRPVSDSADRLPTVLLDVTSEESIGAAARSVVDEYGRVDILVNSAGICIEDDSPFELSSQVWADTLSCNLTGTFLCCREFGQLMAGRRSGSIVNISSIAAFIAGHPEKHLAYDVSKAGVTHMTKVLAAEWADSGVRVNAVAPGRVDTPLLRTITDGRPGVVDAWKEQAPMKRLIALHEVTAAVTFFACAQSSGVTGQTLLVDGGTTLR